MIFSSLEFLVFLVVVLAAVALLPRNRDRKIVLLVASYTFYGFWDWRFLGLIAFSTVVDFIAGRAIDSEQNPSLRKTWLTVSVVTNLGLLGVFKYFNFFIDSLRPILQGFGWETETLSIILPVGISFYTFQSMSYTIDIYRKEIRSTESFVDLAMYVAFFPQLVAGPIVRASAFLPQLSRDLMPKWKDISCGVQIFLIGLTKKLLVADGVAPFVDQVFSRPEYFSQGVVLTAVLGFAVQIYADFSGYSDMAIGCARMFGFRLERNFFMPYLAFGLSDFWRRWHISLSSWLRDYLYLPLGGNRGTAFRTSFNLMLTMSLGGLWHGASWMFVFWGVAHGLGLAVCRPFRNRGILDSTGGRILGTVLTFLFVCLLWIPFRAPDPSVALRILTKMFVSSPGAVWYYQPALVAIGLCVLGHAIGFVRGRKEFVFFDSLVSWRAALSVTVWLWVLFVYAPTAVRPFIYFQF